MQCVGVFDPDAISRTLDNDIAGSALVIVWYQQEPQFPVSADALPALRTVDWDTLATDWQC